MVTAISILLRRAADAEHQTNPERAASLNGASRLAAQHGVTIATWPVPPSGWTWEGVPGAGGRLVRIGVPWWRGGPNEPVQPVADATPDTPAAPAPTPVRITPAVERLVTLVSRPTGAKVEELGATVASARVCVSRARAAGFAIDYDIAQGTYRLASTA